MAEGLKFIIWFKTELVQIQDLTIYFKFLSLSFLICKIGLITIFTAFDC